MRARSLPIFFAALAGCTNGAADGPTAPYVLDELAGAAPAAIPSTLTCVSDAREDGRVTRAWLDLDGGLVSLQDGPQFWSHGGVAEPAPEGLDAERTMSCTRDRTRCKQDGLALRLTRDGLVVRASLEISECYWMTDAALTCWNELELWGSPWAGTSGLADAHLDETTGGCRDALGRPASNAVPVEVVRETGRGECADLRGADLNGADVAAPDLSGWLLAGARLDGAALRHAHLGAASLEGADLSEIMLDDASLEGSIDAGTKLPAGDVCEVVESPWVGVVVTCAR